MIYLDHNATSPAHPQVLEEALPFLTEHFGNPSSAHSLSRRPRAAVEQARARLAAWAGCEAREVVFTGGATEANHLALRGVRRPGRPLVSAVEHPSVLAPGESLGAERIPVDGQGRIRLDALAELLRKPTTVVSVMAANNETGVLSDLPAVADLVHHAGALLHVDAAQVIGRRAAPGRWDLLTVTGHKAGGFKGGGALCVREGIHLAPELLGGGQERGRRSGTTNPAPLVSLGVVATLEHSPELRALRDRFEQAAIGLGGVVTASEAQRLWNTCNVRFPGVPSDLVVMGMDLEGVAVSAGSACSSGASQASPVLTEMGITTADALRVSLGWDTTQADIAAGIAALTVVLERIRAQGLSAEGTA
ncbi:MAG: cysteine desulfurase [Proteobacteria bacterium]|nr:cysteine desulfurase [Pseudomonadota bacterium]